MSSSKLLVMSSDMQRRDGQKAATDGSGLLTQVQYEMSHGYLHVETTGISFRRLATAYAALFRGAWSYSLHSMRSLRRPTTAS